MSEEQQASQQSQAKIKLGDTEYDFSCLSDPAKQLVAALRSTYFLAEWLAGLAVKQQA